jgi:hypothetical protein
MIGHRRLPTGMALCMLLSCASPPAVAQSSSAPTTRSQLHADAFGEYRGKPIATGYLFLDGAYIDSPYTVSRCGVAVLVNGIRMRTYRIQWPPRDWSVREDPGIPPGVTRDTTFDDFPTMDAPWSRKGRYLSHHHAAEDVPELMAQYFRALPFVKSVEYENPRHKDTLKVTTLGGEVRLFDVLPREEKVGGLGPPKASAIQNWLERRVKDIEEPLTKGNCLLLFRDTGRDLRIAGSRVPQTLPAVVEALSSNRSTEDKFKVLELWDVINPGPYDRKVCAPLVKSFKGSPQLSARVQELLDKHPRRPRPMSYWERRDIQQQVLKMKDKTMKEKRELLSKLLRKKQAQIEADFLRAQQQNE